MRCLVIERTQQGHATFDPVELRLFGRNFDRDNVIGRMTGCGESTWEMVSIQGKYQRSFLLDPALLCLT